LPSRRSGAASVHRQYRSYAADFGVPIVVVGNKVEDEGDEAFLRESVGEDLLACFGRSAHVRAMEKGGSPRIDGLEEPGRRALRTIRTALDGRQRDWRRSHDLAVEFHRRNAAAWANAVIGEDVAAELIAQAERGDVDDDRFLDAVRRSLPCAWTVMSGVATRLRDGDTGGRAFADDATPPTEAERGQLLRAFASTAIREAAERRFGVRFAFQNCHRVAAFPAAGADAEYREFTSARAQVLNQTPALRHC
jgi:hypothetical protein